MVLEIGSLGLATTNTWFHQYKSCDSEESKQLTIAATFLSLLTLNLTLTPTQPPQATAGVMYRASR